MSTVSVTLGCGPVQPYADPGEIAEPVDAASYDAAAPIRVLSDVATPRVSDASVQMVSRDRGSAKRARAPRVFVTAARTMGAEVASATSRRLMSASVTWVR